MNGWAMSGSSSGVIAQSSIAKLHSSAKETFSLWVASTFGSATKDDAAAQALPSVTPPPKPLVSLSWEATVPIAAYSLDPPLPNVPAAFPITELRAVPNTGLDHFVMATSSNGKPLYGAYVVNSQGELCLQQLFEFSPTAFDAGVFLPVPTVGGHFQGAYGLDYARHRFNGSIASLPRLMCWPASPTSSRPSVSLNLMGPSVGHDLVPVAASNSVPPTYHDSFMSPQLPTLPHREMLDQANAVSSQLVASSYTDRASSFKDAPEKQLQRVPSSCASKEAVSPPLRNPDEHPQRRVSPNCSDEGVSPLRTPDEHPQQRIPPSCSKEQGVSPLRIPDAHPQQRVPLASCSDEDVSPLRTPNEHPQKRVGTSSGSKEAVPSLRIPDEHPQRRARTPSCSNKADEDPQQRGLEPVKAAPSASQVKASFDGKELASKGAGASRKSWVEASEKPAQCVATRIPDRCHPCFLCDSCKKHWGISGLPEKHFENPRKEVFRIPEEDVPAILCSEKTAARKRKWAQCRHGPKSKTSEYRGVNLYKRTWKWEAHIWHQCEQLYLGASVTKTHAAQVYDRASLYLFGPDAEINFKPEVYQKEYEFMHRLTYGQMVVYLRRESRQNGEEVRYPGVAKMKAKLFCASYRPRKEKESHEHIGYFKTEDDAVRSVLKEAIRRQNYEMAGKILDVHHVRAVKPATGYIKQTRQARAACIVAAIKFAAASEPSKKPSKRSQRVASNPNPAIQTKAAEIPAQELAIAPSTKRKNVKRSAKSTPSAAAKDTPTVPVSKEEPRRSKETGAARPKRKYVRKSTKTEEKSAPKRSTQGPLPAAEVIDPAPAAVAVEASPSQKARGAARKRKITSKSVDPSPAANGSTRVTRLRRQEVVIIPENVATEAPEPASRPRSRKTSTPTRLANPINITSTQVLHPNVATPQPTADVAPSGPILPSAQIIPASSAHPFMRNHPVVAFDFLSGKWSGTPTGSDCSTSRAYSEGESSGALQDSGSTSSSCLSYQSTKPVFKLTELSFQTPPRAVDFQPSREEEMRQFHEACNWLATQRRYLQLGTINTQLPASTTSESPGVIRPVARRLSLTNRTHQTKDAAASGAQINSAKPLPDPEREGGIHLYVDLFGPRNSRSV